jgi:hypothetical protein
MVIGSIQYLRAISIEYLLFPENVMDYFTSNDDARDFF